MCGAKVKIIAFTDIHFDPDFNLSKALKSSQNLVNSVGTAVRCEAGVRIMTYTLSPAII